MNQKKGDNETFTFSRRTDWDKESNSVVRLLNEIKESNNGLIDLTESNPTKCQFSYPNKILCAFNRTDNFNYSPDPKGTKSAREVVAQYYQEKGVNLSEDHVVLTSSTSEGYSYLFRLLVNVQEEVLFPQPSYPLFPFLMDLNDAKILYYHLYYDQNWHIDINSLKNAITDKTKVLCLVNPNNPTGSYITEEELNVINQICLENQLALVCDEVFLDFNFDSKNSFRSILHNKEVLTFVLGGLSKLLGLPQMKLSWIAVNGPTKVKEEALARLEIIGDTYLSVNTPSQNALGQWFSQKSVVQQFILSRIRENFDYLKSTVKSSSGCSVLSAQGGWYAIIRIAQNINEEKLVLELLKKDHIYVHPGYFYDFIEGGHLILSLLPSTELFQEGVQRMLLRIKEL